MHKRRIMDYKQNIVNQVIAAQLLADRACLNNIDRKNLVNNAKKSQLRNSKKDNFKRLANKRVNNSILSLKSISKLSNTKYYSYTKNEIKIIMKILNKEIKKLNEKFKKNNFKI